MHHRNFAITSGKGFHIRFANGVTVSVQFGAGNYGDHYDTPFENEKGPHHIWDSDTAEVAVWGSDDNWLENGKVCRPGDAVEGYQNPEQVLATLNWAAAWRKEVEPDKCLQAPGRE